MSVVRKGIQIKNAIIKKFILKKNNDKNDYI